MFVELGAWRGRSTCYMASRIRETGKDIRFYTVDHCVGSPDEVRTKNPYRSDVLMKPDLDRLGGNVAGELFGNIRACRLERHVVPRVAPSDLAAHLFQDESLDFVFVVGSHTLELVTKDLESWWPKIKRGGLITGHDYDEGWPEVVEAVNRFFQSERVEDVPAAGSWSKLKPR